jgi:hypothetical protein
MSRENALWQRFLAGVERGYTSTQMTIELPNALDALRHVGMTTAQKIAVAEALRNVADQIERAED